MQEHHGLGSVRFGRSIRALGAASMIVLVGCLATSVFGGNPAEEMAKLGATTTTQGGDPKGDSWLSIQHSLEQFAHPNFLLRLFLGLALAVACAWVVAWHPRRSTRLDVLNDLEERKALVILGMVGAIIAELSESSQTLAFVIFGIGALLRFRTVLDNPKLTGKAITVVVIGLACGMGAWAMAVFVTLFSWVLVFWLDSHVSCRLKVRIASKVDPHAIFGEIQSMLAAHRCRVQSSQLYEAKRQMLFLVHMPASLDTKTLESDIREKLPKGDESEIDIRVG